MDSCVIVGEKIHYLQKSSVYKEEKLMYFEKVQAEGRLMEYEKEIQDYYLYYFCTL